MRFLLPVCAVSAGVALAVYIDNTSNPPPRGRAKGEVQYKVYATGRVEGWSDQLELRPQLAGAVAKVHVQEDQLVSDGDVLVELDDGTYGHQVSLAIAEIELAQARHDRLVNGAHPQEIAAAVADYNAMLAEFENAERAWRRIASLRSENVATQQEADDAQARHRSTLAKMNAAQARLAQLKAPARQDELRAAGAQLAAAGSRLELARTELEKTRLRAPRHGRVLAIHIEQGEIAGPQSAQPAIVMADTTRLQVRAFVEELDAPRVQPGMPVEISVDGLPGKSFSGRVSRLAPSMSRKQLYSDAPNERFDTKVREVWIELADTAGLFVGLRVDVTIDPHAAGATEGHPNHEVPVARQPPDTKATIGQTGLAAPDNAATQPPLTPLQPMNNRGP